MTEPLDVELAHAVTRYDRWQEKRKGYNHYALAQYLERAAEVAGEVQRGVELRTALENAFNDRLLDYLLQWFGFKPVGLRS